MLLQSSHVSIESEGKNSHKADTCHNTKDYIETENANTRVSTQDTEETFWSAMEQARSDQDQALETLDLYRYKIPGDGNCMFRAIASQLESDRITQADHPRLRQKTVLWMQDHADELLAAGLLDSLDEIHETSKNGWWPSQAALVAMANILKVNIAVVQGGDKGDIDIQHFTPFDTPADKGCQEGIILAYLYNGHYDAIVNEPNKRNTEYKLWLMEVEERTRQGEDLARNIERYGSSYGRYSSDQITRDIDHQKVRDRPTRDFSVNDWDTCNRRKRSTTPEQEYTSQNVRLNTKPQSTYDQDQKTSQAIRSDGYKYTTQDQETSQAIRSDGYKYTTGFDAVPVTSSLTRTNAVRRRSDDLEKQELWTRAEKEYDDAITCARLRDIKLHGDSPLGTAEPTISLTGVTRLPVAHERTRTSPLSLGSDGTDHYTDMRYGRENRQTEQIIPIHHLDSRHPTTDYSYRSGTNTGSRYGHATDYNSTRYMTTSRDGYRAGVERHIPISTRPSTTERIIPIERSSVSSPPLYPRLYRPVSSLHKPSSSYSQPLYSSGHPSLSSTTTHHPRVRSWRPGESDTHYYASNRTYSLLSSTDKTRFLSSYQKPSTRDSQSRRHSLGLEYV